MRYGSFRGVALAAAALVSVTLSACGDDNQVSDDLSAVSDLSVSNDLTGGNADMAMTVPANGQIVVADVVGTAFAPFGDGGVPVGASPQTPNGVPTHVMAVVVDFPASAGSAQHSSGDTLNGCTWNRYNNLPGGPGPFPAPNENAGTVSITGYDTTLTLAVDTQNPLGQPMPPPATINCAFDATSFHFGCFYGNNPAQLTDRYIFPTMPIPTPSPSPAPQFFNTDLFINANSATLAFTPSPAPSTWTDMRMTTLPNLPKPPHIIAVNGTAATMELGDLTGKLDGTGDVTIDYSCDGTGTKGAGCVTGTLTGLLIQTHLGKKWEAASGANLLRFGTAQCVQSNMDGQFKLTQQMIQDVLGTDMNQTIRVVLVRLKANPTSSGAHGLFMTAGRGNFILLDQ